jgi:hypothetical protein
MHPSRWDLHPTQQPLTATIYLHALLLLFLEKTTYTPTSLSLLIDLRFCAKTKMCKAPLIPFTVPSWTMMNNIPWPTLLTGESSLSYINPTTYFTYTENYFFEIYLTKESPLSS